MLLVILRCSGAAARLPILSIAAIFGLGKQDGNIQPPPQQLPPPPPPMGDVRPPPVGRGPPLNPPPPNRTQQHPPPPATVQHHQFPPPLEFQLQDALYREQDLYHQLGNLSHALAALQQREDLQLRQLDVLTERLTQTEAHAAHERNVLLEVQANCTTYEQQVGELTLKVDELRQKCEHWQQVHQNDTTKLQDMKQKCKKAALEAEDLAAMIERHRLNDAKESYSRLHHRKGGLLGWLFGRSSDDEDYEQMQDAARSTLLKALNEERKSVEDLEVSVLALQRNNSAIAEQVVSRDLIIDELNDRIAVFEEDKLVLKAALRQLQKEMKEEAPKKQKLVESLAKSEKQVAKLQKEIESLIQTHRKEIAALRKAIAEKESAIQMAESNMTQIGTYVDKLEERLTDFAVARRDMESRSKELGAMEDALGSLRREKTELEQKVQSFEAEHEELKGLLSEVASDRANLTQQNSRLSRESSDLARQVNQLQQRIDALEETGRARAAELELANRAATESSSELAEKLRQSEVLVDDLRERLANATALYHEAMYRFQESEASREERDEEVEYLKQEIESLKEKAKKLPPPPPPPQMRRPTTPNKVETALPEEPLSTQPVNPAFVQRIASPEDHPLIKDERVVAEATETTSSTSLTKEPDLPQDGPLTNSTRIPSNSTASSNRTVPEVVHLTMDDAPKESTVSNRTVPSFNRTALPSNRTLARRPPPPSAKRSVPLRGLRKFFSKATGWHGVFTPSSSQPPPPSRRPPNVFKHSAPRSSKDSKSKQ